MIAELKASGARVAYVGDGVNDGPALMAVDVGIATPRAADIARATAGIVLLEDRLDSLAAMLAISQAVMRLIHSNPRVAVEANTAVLMGAVAGLLPVPVTAGLHNGITIAVLIRSLPADPEQAMHGTWEEDRLLESHVSGGPQRSIDRPARTAAA